jgi:tetratricopeptide (TPR) repeat protein/transcriptional regulator with XRE-family HTH domain
MAGTRWVPNDRLKRAREARNLTQAEVADAVGTSSFTVSRWEIGMQRPQAFFRDRLCKFFGSTAAELGLFPGPPPLQAAPARGPAEPASAPAAAEPAETPPSLLPDPGSLPPGSRMPRSRNALFVGRTGDLQRLAGALIGGPAAAPGRAVAITGMGGLGKTQLAIEFVHRYGSCFPGGVFWLSFASSGDVALEVAACGGDGFMELRPDFDTLPLQQRLVLVASAWRDQAPRLLVFDNCEEEALLELWRPTTGGCRVLVTARRSSWDLRLGVQLLPLSVLTRPESRQLLCRYLPASPPGDPVVDAIAGEVGDLPLALHLAGSFLRRYGDEVSPADYLNRLRDPSSLDQAARFTAGIADSIDTARTLQGVAQSFDLSFRRLNDRSDIDRTARSLLARIACLAPSEPVARELLMRTMGEPAELHDRLLRADALHRLRDLSLVELSSEGLRVHRLLMRFLRIVCVDDEARRAVDEVLLADGRLAADGHLTSSRLLAVVHHLRHVTETALEQGDDARAAALSNALGVVLQYSGEVATALPYLERALAIRERVLGPEHVATACTLNDLGGLLAEMGELASAGEALERALDIRRRALTANHPDLVNSMSNYANLLWARGDPEAARVEMEAVLSVRERTLGKEHPDVARSLNNLGVALHALGDLEAARGFHERSLALRERALGPDHLETAQSLNNLGFLLLKLGDVAAARSCHERGHAIVERSVGPNHPELARSLHSLAYSTWMDGDLPAARSLHERALAIRERVFGARHLDSGRSLYGLALVMRDQGEARRARSLMARALDVMVRGLGHDHPTAREIRAALADLDASRQCDDIGVVSDRYGHALPRKRPTPQPAPLDK